MLRPRCALVLVLVLVACRPQASPSPATAVTIPPVPEGIVEPESDQDDVAAVRPEPSTWKGRGVQNDGQSWDLVVELLGHDRTPCATVQYPPQAGATAACGGEWHCKLPPSTPHHLIAVEHIVEGEDRCIDRCQVDADLRTGVIAFDCSHAGVTAEAQVRRVK